MKNNILVGAIIAIVVLIGAYFILPRQVVNTVVERLGAVSTLDGIDSSYTSIGGLKTWFGTLSMTATSVVPCTIPNPFGATSTIVRASHRITTGLLGANSITLSTSSTAQATGSIPALMLSHSIGSNAQDYAMWFPIATTTQSSSNKNSIWDGINSDGSSPILLRPTESLQWRVATITPGTGFFTGSCSAVIHKL